MTSLEFLRPHVPPAPLSLSAWLPRGPGIVTPEPEGVSSNHSVSTAFSFLTGAWPMTLGFDDDDEADEDENDDDDDCEAGLGLFDSLM